MSDGTIVAWGDNGYWQLNIPAPNANFIAIAAGFHHNLGLKSDGSIVTWGYQSGGALNVPAPNSNFVGVAAANGRSYGLKELITGACCTGELCTDVTESSCLTLGGEFSGNGSICSKITCASPCPDQNGDNNINVTDLLQIIGTWGPCASCPEDLNGDGIVNVTDILELISAWGPCVR